MNSTWYRFAAWVIRLVLVAAMVQQIVVGDVVGALAMALFLVLSFAYLLRDDRLPTAFDALVVVAAVLNALGFVFNFYKRIVAYDNVAHAVTIFAITLAFFFLVYRDTLTGTGRLPMATVVFTFGVTVGALWEIAEWTTGQIFDIRVIFGLKDAITDLITNSVAALVAAGVALVMAGRRSGEQERSQDDRVTRR